MSWYVHEDGKTFFPRVAKALERSGKWRVPSLSKWPYIRCEPVGRTPFVWLELSYRRVGIYDVPGDGWSIVEVSWVDPEYGPRRFKRGR